MLFGLLFCFLLFLCFPLGIVVSGQRPKCLAAANTRKAGQAKHRTGKRHFVSGWICRVTDTTAHLSLSEAARNISIFAAAAQAAKAELTAVIRWGFTADKRGVQLTTRRPAAAAALILGGAADAFPQFAIERMVAAAESTDEDQVHLIDAVVIKVLHLQNETGIKLHAAACS